MRVLIVGFTGGTGRELVRQALERGHQVTALARRPEKLAIEHENLRVVRGDVAAFMLNQLTDDTYLRACPGVAW